MNQTSSFRHLVLENPMLFEATRVARRFIRTGGDTGRAVNYTVLGLLGILYAWLLFAVVRYREDLSEMLMMFQVGILTLALPASLYGAISGEKERLTWDALIMTRLTPSQIVAGKMLWRVALAAGLVTLFIPPLLLCHFAGKQPRPDYLLVDLIHTQGIIFAWSLLLIGFSLWVSAATKRTATSLALLSGALLGFLALVPILVSLFGGSHELPTQKDPFGVLGVDWSNPLRILGVFLVHLHPFYILDAMRWRWGYQADIYGRWQNDLLMQWGWADYLPFLYLAGAAWFTAMTYRRLRGMELPSAGRH